MMQPGGGPPYLYARGPYPGPPTVPSWGAPAPLPPRPRGAPTRSVFVVGAVGHFLGAGIAIPFSLLVIMFGFFFFFGSFSTFLLGFSIMFTIGLLLHLIGFFGLWKNYGSAIGLVVFAYGVVATSLLQASVALLFVGRDPLYTVIGGVSYVAVGLMFILEGAAYLLNRPFLPPAASVAAGALFILSGGFFCSVVLTVIGGLAAVPALIVGGIVLLAAPIPVPYAPPPEYGTMGQPPPPP